MKNENNFSPSAPHYSFLQESTDCHRWGLGEMQACETRTKESDTLHVVLFDGCHSTPIFYFSDRCGDLKRSLYGQELCEDSVILFLCSTEKEKTPAVFECFFFFFGC